MADLLAPVGSVRTAVVRTTIGAFSLAALLGIVALVGGRAFGSIEGRVLLTTLLAGVVSVLVLCYLLTAGTRYQPVGVLGGAMVLVPLVTGLFLVWYDYETDPPQAIARAFGVGAVAAVSLAQASLLLAIGSTAGPVVRRLLLTTLALAGVLAVQVCALVLGLDAHADYLRLLGVVAILDVLGTVVVAALTRFGAATRMPASVRSVVLPASVVARAGERARATGESVEEVVASAVEAYLVQTPVS
jgi:hypothetical protein